MLNINGELSCFGRASDMFLILSFLFVASKFKQQMELSYSHVKKIFSETSRFCRKEELE